MKSASNTEGLKEGQLKTDTKKMAANGHNPLKTDYPLSEKDQVKQAEENMRKSAKRKML